MIYELSCEAEKDIELIFDFTVDEYGLQQAVSYIEKFESCFQQLLLNPQLGRSRNEIRQELRSLIQEQHVIFYRVLTDRIRVVRVLHGRSDIAKFL